MFNTPLFTTKILYRYYEIGYFTGGSDISREKAVAEVELLVTHTFDSESILSIFFF